MTRPFIRPTILARLSGMLRRTEGKPATRRDASLQSLSNHQLHDIGLVRVHDGRRVLRYTDFG
jgi:uncharacterized protein YjiS (DUF1127 family)